MVPAAGRRIAILQLPTLTQQSSSGCEPSFMPEKFALFENDAQTAYLLV
jgi:hypothetical protein